MRKYFFTVIGFILLGVYFNACNLNKLLTPSTGKTTSGSAGNYYPNGDGTSYKYSINKTDSAGNEISGSRTVTYNGTSNLGSVTYQVEVDTTTVSALVSTTNSLFIKDSTGVSIVLDTTGLYKIIPAVYQQYVKVGQKIKIFQSSFLNGSQWTVYDVSIVGAPIPIDLINIVASFTGIEKIPLNLNSNAVTDSAAEIKYIITLSIPNAKNPLDLNTLSYTAYAWLVTI
jgi:hypothetical protein